MSDGGECEAWGFVECDALYFGACVSEGHAASIFSIEDAASRRELSVIYRIMTSLPLDCFQLSSLPFLLSVLLTVFFHGRKSFCREVADS